MATSDEEYKNLAKKVYEVETDGSKIVPGEPVKVEGVWYRVLAVENNTSNGFQAMAVAPVRNGKVVKDEIVVAYAGTRLTDVNDLNEDAAEIISGTHLPGGQFDSARAFYERVELANPGVRISTTGHSLGGTLALAVAAETHSKSVTYCAPDPSVMMSDEAKQWAIANRGELHNHRIAEDFIGNYGGDPLGISDYSIAVQNYKHDIVNFTFNSDGSHSTSLNSKQREDLLSQASWVQASLAVVASGGDMTPLCVMARQYR